MRQLDAADVNVELLSVGVRLTIATPHGEGFAVDLSPEKAERLAGQLQAVKPAPAVPPKPAPVAAPAAAPVAAPVKPAALPKAKPTPKAKARAHK